MTGRISENVETPLERTSTPFFYKLHGISVGLLLIVAVANGLRASTRGERGLLEVFGRNQIRFAACRVLCVSRPVESGAFVTIASCHEQQTSGVSASPSG